MTGVVFILACIFSLLILFVKLSGFLAHGKGVGSGGVDGCFGKRPVFAQKARGADLIGIGKLYQADIGEENLES